MGLIGCSAAPLHFLSAACWVQYVACHLVLSCVVGTSSTNGELSMQAKMLRLTANAPAVEAAQEVLAQLRAENEELHADNARLASYLDSLEAGAPQAVAGAQRVQFHI